MDSFYVFLHNRAKHPAFDNSNARFVTDLAEDIILNGEYEVALSEISLTRSWWSIQTTQEVRIKYKNQNYEDAIGYIMPGYYPDPAEVVKLVDRFIDEYAEASRVDTFGGYPKVNMPSIKFDSHSGLVTRTPGYHIKTESEKDTTILTFESELFAYFGFKEDHEMLFIDSNVMDIGAGGNDVYVYTDIVKHSRMGDGVSQLLRMITVPRKRLPSEDYHVIYSNPIYLPVNSTRISNIEIELQNANGQQMKFNGGRTWVTLHFRKKA
ncbi:hypothetical protein HDE_14407 [Halotydeus destructor]|nr:hypothetical protein HDE_14407 [Halotydeus destructor]